MAWLGSPITSHPQPQPRGGKGLSDEESPAGLEPRFSPQAAVPHTQLPPGGSLQDGSNPHQVPENLCPKQSPIPDTVAREGLSYSYGGAGAARSGAATPIPPLRRIPPMGTGAQHLRAQQSEAPNNLPKGAPSRHPLATGQSLSQHRAGEASPKLLKYLLLQPRSCSCPLSHTLPSSLLFPLSGSHDGEGAPRQLQMNDNEIQSLQFGAFPLSACPEKLSSQLRGSNKMIKCSSSWVLIPHYSNSCTCSRAFLFFPPHPCSRSNGSLQLREESRLRHEQQA